MHTAFLSFDGTQSVDARLLRPDRYERLFHALDTQERTIARGAGLSYCCASAGAGVTSISSELFDRILAFDADSRQILVEPGLTIGELWEFAVANGCYPPVVPGHPAITIGGCVAANVHGKNQYRVGNFGDWIERLGLYHPDHGEIHCSRTENPELFRLTLGGFGLTGFITSALIRLQPLAGRSVHVRRISVHDLLETVEVMASHEGAADSVYSWHDLNRRGASFGRGVVYVETFRSDALPEHRNFRDLSPATRSRLRFPLINSFTASLLTLAYLGAQNLKKEEELLDLRTAAFPINGKEVYYSLFGRRGFREYQLLVPHRDWAGLVHDLEGVLNDAGVSVALASLKMFRGTADFLNFGGEGICLAINVPAAPKAIDLFSRIDRLVIAGHGMVNISKDSRLPREVVQETYRAYGEFRAALREYDPRARCSSLLRERLDV